MKIAVTGGSGFLGHNFSLKLLEHHHQVVCLDMFKADYLDACKIPFIQGDLSQPELIDAALAGADAVLHLACTVIPQSSNASPVFDVESNVCATLRLLDSAVRSGIKKFVFISSGGTVYGTPEFTPIPESHVTNPECSYGITKLTIEKYLRLYQKQYGMECCSLRLSNPYGEYQRIRSQQGAIPVFCYRILTGTPIQIWGDGTQKRDFIYVGDVADAVLKALEMPCKGEINIGSGKAVSLNEILTEISNITGKIPDVRYLAKRDFDVPVNVLDCRKAAEILQWKPQTSLSAGIARLLAWIQQTYIEK